MLAGCATLPEEEQKISGFLKAFGHRPDAETTIYIALPPELNESQTRYLNDVIDHVLADATMQRAANASNADYLVALELETRSGQTDETGTLYGYYGTMRLWEKPEGRFGLPRFEAEAVTIRLNHQDYLFQATVIALMDTLVKGRNGTVRIRMRTPVLQHGEA